MTRAPPPLERSFYALTPERVLDAVESAGRRCTGRFIVLNSYENRVYQLELAEGGFVVAKFYRPGRWSEDAILEEHSFLLELDAAEVPVAAPIRLPSGRTLERAEGIAWALFPRVGGRAPDDMDDEQLRQLGRQIARLHAVGRTRRAPARRRMSPRAWLAEPRDELLRSGLLSPEQGAALSRLVDGLLSVSEPLWRGVRAQRIHGDCHLGNLLRVEGGFVFLDLDDLVEGPPVQDLWMLYGGRDAWALRRRDLMIEGYEMFADFDRGTLRLVEALRAMRMTQHLAWLARRRDDPAVRAGFPDFGSRTFWERELRDLADQAAAVRDSLSSP